VFTVLCNLVFLPALIQVARERKERGLAAEASADV
jgi:hypothetical protein